SCQCLISVMATKAVVRTLFSTKISIQETWLTTHSAAPAGGGLPCTRQPTPQNHISSRDQCLPMAERTPGDARGKITATDNKPKNSINKTQHARNTKSSISKFVSL